MPQLSTTRTLPWYTLPWVTVGLHKVRRYPVFALAITTPSLGMNSSMPDNGDLRLVIHDL